MGGGPPCFPQDFSCPAVLWVRLPVLTFPYGSVTLFGAPFQKLRVRYRRLSSALNPTRPQTHGLASCRFARHYSGNRVFFLFLRVLRCFTSPGALLTDYLIHLWMTAHYRSQVPPFGDPGINAYLQLPQAFRSLSRPSSAISALASTLRSYSLDLLRKLSWIALES